ncbi:hypothetical protein TL16_g00583 [Triparma laevis f. inornata]|uniref:Acyl-CoA dehydrogenase family member 11 n=1 Tax=Triparma laevis f. inornata TaxID=1714386 RepID=A0A9W6ZG15_9STRA|nr:hypothetical protein TL16_g00583 [Triparma laevis f. inornata]
MIERLNECDQIGQQIIESESTLSQFTHGQSNPTYILTSPTSKLVIRRKPPGKILPSAHAIEREYTVLKALGTTDFPVPKVLFLEENRDVIGTEFYVYEYVNGTFYKDCAMAGATIEQRKAGYEGLISTAAKLHTLDYESIGLEKYGKPDNYLSRTVETWMKQYNASLSHSESDPTMSYLYDFLKDNLPGSTRNSIVHGDLRVDNMLFTDAEVAGVVDWELSTLGEPFTDVGLLMTPYHTKPEMPIIGGLMGVNLDSVGIPREEEFVERYVDKTGFEELGEQVDYHLTFNAFRMSSILQGVYDRAKGGNASSEQALQVGKLAGFVAQQGKKHAGRFMKGNRFGEGGTGAAFTGKRAFSSSARQFSSSAKGEELKQRVKTFIDEKVMPIETEVLSQGYNGGDDEWKEHPLLDGVKAEARAAGLWNLFLPAISGCSNLEYASVAEQMGRSLIASECFNCQAPDTGNMEVLHMFGTDEQQATYLDPLMEQSIRSGFGMTEPGVASSDATNMSASITETEEGLVLNGKKWWTSNGCHPELKMLIFMGRDSDADDKPRHQQHSMVLVPFPHPGVTVERPLKVFGYTDAPHGHAEINFDNVVVPKSAYVAGKGDGFMIAQARLGPGRIHHCMRLIGMAERSLDLAVRRGEERTAFGKKLKDFQVNRHYYAESRMAIDSTRLMVLNAAKKIDEGGAKNARKEIAMIKIMAPEMAMKVVDGAMQIHGGAGLSQDYPLAHFYAWARVLKLADGPSEVHLDAVAKQVIRDVEKGN